MEAHQRMKIYETSQSEALLRLLFLREALKLDFLGHSLMAEGAIRYCGIRVESGGISLPDYRKK
uniref:Uncharacterized protein n=1 Tax=Romanomermis culicivorax TaxID=13658 RepID=A0A915JH70_ROMCU